MIQSPLYQNTKHPAIVEKWFFCVYFSFSFRFSLQVEPTSTNNSVFTDLWDTVIRVAVVLRAAVMGRLLNIRIIRFVRSSGGTEPRVFTHGRFVHQTRKLKTFFPPSFC